MEMLVLVGMGAWKTIPAAEPAWFAAGLLTHVSQLCWQSVRPGGLGPIVP